MPILCKHFIEAPKPWSTNTKQGLNQNNIIINLSLKHSNTLYNTCLPIHAVYRYNLYPLFCYVVRNFVLQYISTYIHVFNYIYIKLIEIQFQR